MLPRPGGGPGTALGVKIETSEAATAAAAAAAAEEEEEEEDEEEEEEAEEAAEAAAAAPIPRIGSPIPPTPAASGPRPCPRFGANAAWKHFFHMVALGGGGHQHDHERSKSEGDAQRMAQGAVATAETAGHHRPLLKDSTRSHLEKIFAQLRARAGDYVVRERLQEFLQETQGGLVRPLDQQVYTLGDFMYIWWHDYSKALRPAPPKDLSKPISNYFISSSHNTYIGLGNQLNGEVSAQAYRTVLEGDCRCVEIDVWNGEGWADARARTPSTPKSPPPARPDPDLVAPAHARQPSALAGLSAAALPAAAQSLVDLMEAHWRAWTGGARAPRRGRIPRASSASASMSQLHLTLPTASYSTCSLDNDLLRPSDVGRAPLRHARSVESLGVRGRTARAGSRSASRAPPRTVEPEVTHAHTVQGLGDVGLARRIPLREVCRVIRDAAFRTNKLPIIVSLEVHATGAQQDMMVDIMKEEWGHHLLDMRLEGCDPNERQPRLEELLEKILVKVKRPPPLGLHAKGSSQLTVPMVDDDGSLSDDERALADDAFPKSGDGHAGVVKTAKTKIRETLGRLAIYTHSEHFKGFSGPGSKTLTHIYSIDEYKILKLHQTKHREMFIHNRNYFMRAYPHSTRVNSTNLDPSLYWRKGVQMVALNWQRSQVDEAMMLNSAMFESEQGWVLKPEGYLGDDMTIAQAHAGRHRTLEHLRITILAGQLLPLPGEADDGSDACTLASARTADSTSLRPLVKCELHVETPEERNEKKAIRSGLAQDGQYKLVSKSSETENPDWGAGHVLEFPPKIDQVVEELSFVRFKVEDEGLVKDRLAAWACIRLDRLQQGYRFIDLKDAYGKPSAGRLLVKIDKLVQ